MRDIAPEDIEALTGSRTGDRVVATSWYDGALTHADLPVTSWRMQWSGTRQVQAQGDLTVADPEGVLLPWGVDDPLGVGGALVRLTYIHGLTGNETLIGEYRITRTDVAESYEFQRVVTGHDQDGLPIYALELVPRRSGEVTASLDDLTWGVGAAEFLGPESVRVTNSVVGEIERLCDGIVPVAAHPSIEDASVPSGITYDGSRLDAIGSLVNAIDAKYRMSGDGVLELIPVDPGPSVWDIAPGEDGVLVDFGRSYSADELINTAVVEGKTDDDDPLIGVARETSGPLSVDGPHGLVPAFRQSDILTTQASVDRAAQTYLRRFVRDRSITLPITCLPHPGLQIGDTVRLRLPVGDLTGPITEMSLSGNEDGLDPMQLGIVVDLETVQMIAARLRRGEKLA